MNDIKKIIARFLIYFTLLGINILLSIGPIINNFPTRNITVIFLLLISIVLILYYSHRVVPNNKTSLMMKLLSWMAFSLVLLRGIKYSVFSQVDVLARYSWYLYYIPILLIPLFLFNISISISPKSNKVLSTLWYVFLGITSILIILVLTNDLHQQIFRFNPNFENWNDDYNHGWLFYVLYAFQFSLLVASIVILIFKCRISASKRNVWVFLVPIIFGIAMYILLLTGTMPKIGGSAIIEFPEAHVFTIALILECCIQLGLIPTNNAYKEIFNNLPINIQITNESGDTIYLSESAKKLNKEQFLLDDGARTSEHIILHKMQIPGGYGFFQSDVSELDYLNEQLEEVNEGLEEESQIIKLQNDNKEKETKIKQRALLYDIIAKNTQKQSQEIYNLAEEAKKSNDLSLKDKNRNHITLLGSYIKRYANLTILSQENEYIEVGELGISIAEVLRYLNICKIPGEFVGESNALIKTKDAISVFESFFSVIENNLSSAKGVFVNISVNEQITIKLIIENLKTLLSKEELSILENNDIKVDVKQEDDVSYIYFNVKKGDIK